MPHSPDVSSSPAPASSASRSLSSSTAARPPSSPSSIAAPLSPKPPPPPPACSPSTIPTTHPLHPPARRPLSRSASTPPSSIAIHNLSGQPRRLPDQLHPPGHRTHTARPASIPFPRNRTSTCPRFPRPRLFPRTRSPFHLLDEHSASTPASSPPHSSPPSAAHPSVLLAHRTPRSSPREHTPSTTALRTSPRVGIDTRAPSTFVDCTGAWARPTTSPPRCRHAPAKARCSPSPFRPRFPSHRRRPHPRRSTSSRAPSAPTPAAPSSAPPSKTSASTNPPPIHTRRHPHPSTTAQAANLLPALASAPILEQWAGLRPATPMASPSSAPHPAPARATLFATGHFRNGILLAPATAHVLARPPPGEPLIPHLDLSPFSPTRTSIPHPLQQRRLTPADIRRPERDNRFPAAL